MNAEWIITVFVILDELLAKGGHQVISSSSARSSRLQIFHHKDAKALRDVYLDC